MSVDFREAGEQETDGGIGPFPFQKGCNGGGRNLFITVSWVIS